MENKREPRDLNPCVYVPPREGGVMQSIVHPQPWLDDEPPPKSAPGPAELSEPAETETAETPVIQEDTAVVYTAKKPRPAEAVVKPRNPAPVKPRTPPRPATPKSEKPADVVSDESDDEPIF